MSKDFITPKSPEGEKISPAQQNIHTGIARIVADLPKEFDPAILEVVTSLVHHVGTTNLTTTQINANLVFIAELLTKANAPQDAINNVSNLQNKTNLSRIVDKLKADKSHDQIRDVEESFFAYLEAYGGEHLNDVDVRKLAEYILEVLDKSTDTVGSTAEVKKLVNEHFKVEADRKHIEKLITKLTNLGKTSQAS